MQPIYDTDGTTIIGYTYSNGYAVWAYNTSWQVTNIAVDTAAITSGALTPLLDGNSATTGYTYTDAYGALYTYSVDTSGAVTGYTTNYSGPGYSYTYSNDELGNFTGYTYFDGTTTTTYDAGWNVVSTVAAPPPGNQTPILDADGVTVIGYSTTDEWGTATNYALDGTTVTGYVYTYVDAGNNTTSVTTYDANWSYLGSETTNTTTQAVLYSNSYSYLDGVFNGYTSFDGTTITVYDANWVIVSSTANTAGMTELFAADGTTLIGYSTTDVWGTTTIYNTSGVKTGSSYFDGVTTTTYDANWNFVSSTANTSGMTAILDTDGVTVIGYSHTVPNQWGGGSNTTTYDANGNKTGSSNTWTDTWSGNVITSYQDANGNFLGSETRNVAGDLLYSNFDIYTGGVLTGHTSFDGTTTTTYDANWNLLGSAADTSSMTPILGADGVTVVGYSKTVADPWGGSNTTTYDAAGNKTGSSNTFTDWNGNHVTSYQDANWNFLGSETRNTAGALLFSNFDIYTNGVVTGHTNFDGVTTTTYDASWNFVSSTVNTAAMTPIL
ncbi:MAG: hypothetical protein HZC43_11640 [Nitrosomonadales bacterium]|nr:hypothetical protein [Nitrosomonadales bacterium]